jgi:hypothetical protein
MTTPSEDKLEEMQQKMDTSSTTRSSDKVRERIAAKIN